jgi:hypothetical protein
MILTAFLWRNTRNHNLIFYFNRLLARDDIFGIIAFSYLLGHSAVQKIIQEVCKVTGNKFLAERVPTPKNMSGYVSLNNYGLIGIFQLFWLS